MTDLDDSRCDDYFLALSKFVPPPFNPPTTTTQSPIPSLLQNNNETDENTIPTFLPETSAAQQDNLARPQRSSSEPPILASQKMQSPKRKGDDSPRSDTMSPARKVPRIAAGTADREEPDFAALLISSKSRNSENNSSNNSANYSVIDEYFGMVARTGLTMFPWDTIRNAFLWKLESVCWFMWKTAPYVESSTQKSPRVPSTENPVGEVYVQRILESASVFQGIPFTIQRLCELITQPTRHYKRADKYFRALEKNLNIVSTVAPDGERETREHLPLPSFSLPPLAGPVTGKIATACFLEEESPEDAEVSSSDDSNRIHSPVIFQSVVEDSEAPTVVSEPKLDVEEPENNAAGE